MRRRYLASLYKHTGRNVILYVSDWLQKNDVPPALISVGDEDIQALIEVSHEFQGCEKELILHSPGGSPEAIDS